ncbi:hypothetical protein K491DRAFT_689020 [Lophiostoma macrostomum CBS 122681]|uniref:Uncharacterized protein n=1 Tax=Lophiostoma macrostomum CBS 122681 TaxID=1314788 RepID=A0A6A6TIF0_9PLEO|nr:hypothetical protein K491DRAFT_689020 [Lophiostoma macrostomum CBS 122681]
MVRRGDTRQYWFQVVKGTPLACDLSRTQDLRDTWNMQWDKSYFKTQLEEITLHKFDRIQEIDHVFCFGTAFTCIGAHDTPDPSKRESYMSALMVETIYATVLRQRMLPRVLFPKLTFIGSDFCDVCITYLGDSLAKKLQLDLSSFSADCLRKRLNYKGQEGDFIRQFGSNSLIVVQDCDIPVLQIIGDLSKQTGAPAAILCSNAFKKSPGEHVFDDHECWHANFSLMDLREKLVQRLIPEERDTKPSGSAGSDRIFSKDMALLLPNTVHELEDMPGIYANMVAGLEGFDLRELLNEEELSQLKELMIFTSEDLSGLFQQMASGIKACSQGQIMARAEVAKVAGTLEKIIPIIAIASRRLTHKKLNEGK